MEDNFFILDLWKIKMVSLESYIIPLYNEMQFVLIVKPWNVQ